MGELLVVVVEVVEEEWVQEVGLDKGRWKAESSPVVSTGAFMGKQQDPARSTVLKRRVPDILGKG